uniref:Uncharacterized protein n=1 Tax=Onchocerca volvulus TaxID=6282 RepID=A0A2K6W6S2_ONCVO
MKEIPNVKTIRITTVSKFGLFDMMTNKFALLSLATSRVSIIKELSFITISIIHTPTVPFSKW